MAAPSFVQLLDDFKSNPRLRAGIGFAIAIFWLYGNLHLQDVLAVRTTEYETLTKRITRVQAAGDQKEWRVRADEVRELEKNLADRLWREQTQGLAQAAFQDWLVQTLQQAAIAKPQVTVAAQEGPKPREGARGAGDIWKVSARVAFDFNPKTFTQFVDKLASNDKLVVVETLNVRSLPSPRAEMTFVAYFAKSAEAPPQK